MNENLQYNLNILKDEHFGLYQYLIEAINEVKLETLSLDEVADSYDLEKLRSISFIHFSVSNYLTDLITNNKGEYTLIIVEDKRDKLLLFFSLHKFNKAMLSKEKINFVYSEKFNTQNLREKLLATPIMINHKKYSSEILSYRVLKFIATVYETEKESLKKNHIPYFIMISYNRFEFTEKVIQRLQLNTFTDFKLVIVDNNSESLVKEELFKIKEKYSFIEKIIFFDQNLGIGRALNNAIKYCQKKTSIIGRIDNDILVPPFWLRDLLTVYNSSFAPAIVGGFVTTDKIILNEIFKAKVYLTNDLKFYQVNKIGGCLNIYRSEIFETLGFFPEKEIYGVEDGGLNEALNKAKGRIAIVDNVKIEHLPDIIKEDDAYKKFKKEQVEIFKKKKNN